LLDTPYSEIINRKFCTRYGIPYNPWNYGVYAKELNIVGEALRNIIANNGLENSFDNATEVVLNHLKSGYVEVDGKKKWTYVNNIQQWYYYDVDGKFKDEEYTNDIHEAFAVVVTPEILKQVMEEYKRLAEVE
jgi:ribosome biogenesis protein Nip4